MLRPARLSPPLTSSKATVGALISSWHHYSLSLTSLTRVLSIDRQRVRQGANMIERNWSEIYSYFNIFSRCFLKFSSPRDKTFLGHSSLANSTRSTSSIRSCTRESGCLQHRRASGFWEHGNSQGNMKPRDRDSRHMYTKTTRFRCQVCSTFAGSIGSVDVISHVRAGAPLAQRQLS